MRAVEPLKSASKDRDSLVRSTVVEALGLLSQPLHPKRKSVSSLLKEMKIGDDPWESLSQLIALVESVDEKELLKNGVRPILL